MNTNEVLRRNELQCLCQASLIERLVAKLLVQGWVESRRYLCDAFLDHTFARACDNGACVREDTI